MAQQTIGLGTVANDGTGDDLREAGGKINANFTELYAMVAAAGGTWKDPVRAATTANGTLATAFENGDTIDGVVLATGDRILLKNQSSGSENGIYTVNASGAPTRATDADSGAEMVNAAALVSEGTANADKLFVCTTNAPITINSTALTFVDPFASAVVNWATGAEFRVGTEAAKAVSPDTVWDAADLVALNDSGGNIAVDLSTGLNFSMTMDGDYNLSNPTNAKNGQEGVIVFTQDGTGTQTLTYSGNWKFVGGADPTLSTDASAVDVLFYKVISSSFIIASLGKAFA